MSFTVQFTSGVTLEPWTDPPDASRPSRLNAAANRSHLRRVGTVDSMIELTAVGIPPGPDDDSYRGLFVEAPGQAPSLSSPPGQSHILRFTPRAIGHHCLVVRRDGGRGGVFVHLDVLEAR